LVRAAIAFHLSLFAFQLQAATTSLDSQGKYYFKIPSTTNISGRVMGDGGDYKLVRQEDLCWLDEAFAERNALAEGFNGAQTNMTAALVKLRTFDGPIANVWYDPNVVGVEAKVQGGLGSWIRCAGFTNIDISTTNLPARRLVSMGRITNLYHTARLASRICPMGGGSLADSISYSFDESQTGSSVRYYEFYEDRHEAGSYEVLSDEREWHWTRVDTGNVLSFASSEDSKFTYSWVGCSQPGNTDFQEWIMDLGPVNTSKEHKMKIELTYSSGNLEIEQACNTNAWLRGGDTPMRFIRKIEAWGLVHIEVGQRGSTIEEEYVVMRLGEPRFVRCGNQSLVWSVSIDRDGLTDRSVGVAGTHGPSWAIAASVKQPAYPSNEMAGQSILDTGGMDYSYILEYQTSNGASDTRRFEAILSTEIVLVIDIKPATMLGGW